MARAQLRQSHVLHLLDDVGPVDWLVQPLAGGVAAEQGGLVFGPGEGVVVVGAVRHCFGPLPCCDALLGACGRVRLARFAGQAGDARLVLEGWNARMTHCSAAVELTAVGYRLPRYPGVVPEAVRTGAVEAASVVIVGGGLTGLTLAVDLAQRGVRAVLLDDDDTVGVRGASSRGIVYAQKSLEVMDRLGVAGRMVAKGVTWSVGKTLSGDGVVFSFDRATESVSQQPAFINLQQFYLEWCLVDRLVELGGAVRWANRVTAVAPAEEGVRLTVETPEGGYCIAAEWVVDATGANSPVRAALGLVSRAATAVDRWCICDVRCPGLAVPERWTWVDAPFNGGRAVWQHMMADQVWRLDYQLDPASDPADAASLEVAAARVREHFGPDMPFEIVWVGPWQYRAQLIDRFRAGRILFAGDAAHVMSPFGARGGNSSIQDADNLGWKLALVVGGQAPEGLLDSYDAERRPAAAENIRVTSRTTRFLAPQSPFEHRLRSAVLGLAREHGFARALVNTGRLSLPSVYADSPVIYAGAGFALPNFMMRDAAGQDVTLNGALREAAPGSLGLYAPLPGDDPCRAKLPGIGERGVCAVRTVDVGAGAAGCELVDSSGVLGRLTGLAAGGFAAVRQDLYCAGVLRHPDAGAAEALLARSIGVGPA